MSGHKVDLRGEEPIFKYVHTKLENEFVDHTKVWSPKLGRVLEQMIQCVALGGWALPCYIHLAST